MISPRFQYDFGLQVKLPYRTEQKKTEKYKTPYWRKSRGVACVDSLELLRRNRVMGSTDLKEAKQRVRLHLVEPLMRLGLRRPSGMTVAQFDEMVDELCGRLSYMTPLNLEALAEQAALRPGGKDGSRFPFASKILAWAAEIQRPEDSASPLMIAVFSGEIGREAMAEDWAPELLSHLRKHRLWPKKADIAAIKKRAEEARHQIAKSEERVRRGFALSSADQKLKDMRGTAAMKCQRIMQQIEVQQ